LRNFQSWALPPKQTFDAGVKSVSFAPSLPVVNSLGYSHGGVIRWWWKMAGLGEVGVTIVSEEEIVALAGVL
jgi:hypothetical protein